MTFKKLLDDQIANAFSNTLGKGGLTEDITIRFITGEGTYDLATDSYTHTQTETLIKNVMVAGVTYDDMQKHGALSSDAKLLIPGKFLTTNPDPDTDKVIRSSGLEWDVRKTVEVPGGSMVIVYIYRT